MRGPAVLFTLLLAAAVAVFLLSRPPATPGPPAAAAGPASAAPSRIDGGESQAPARRPAAAEVAEVRSAELAAGEGEVPMQEVDCTGVVVADPSGAPLAAHHVALGGLGSAGLRAITDDAGRFRVEVAESDWRPGRYVRVTVRDTDAALLLQSAVALAPEIVLRVPDRVHLSGRLVTQPPRDTSGFHVSVSLPRSEALTSALYCGQAALDADGSFALDVREPLPTDDYDLLFADGTSFVADARVPRAELTSEGGATIECFLTALYLVVVDEDERPIPSARLRLSPTGPSAALRWNACETDARGRTSLVLTGVEYELCVHAPGHVAQVERLALDARVPSHEHVVRLRRLGERDQLRGEVLSPAGEPVAEAVVTAAPVTANADVAVAGMVQARTDQHGRFEMPVAVQALLRVSAYHRDHGLTELPPLVPGYRPLRLRFETLGALRVELTGQAVGAHADGPVQAWLLSPTGEVAGAGHGSAPLVLEELPAGPHVLLVRGPGAATYGRAAVQVEATSQGEPSEVHVTLDPALHVAGRVVDGSGAPLAGLALVAHHPDWPAQVRAAWGRALTDADGRFRLFAGDRAPLEVLVLDGSRELARETLDAGEEQRIRVPR